MKKLVTTILMATLMFATSKEMILSDISLAENRQAIGDYNQSISILENTISTTPNLPDDYPLIYIDVIIQLADLYYQVGNEKKSEQLYIRASLKYEDIVS